MTWAKPNFLWMMFRSGWATKKNQEKILAFRVNRFWFDNCLLSASLSGKDKDCKNKDVVVQWDPDHTPGGKKHKSRRAIQIGIRKHKIIEWAQGVKGPAIIEMIDITELVHESNAARQQTGNFIMPRERIYPLEAKNIHLMNDATE
jgi:Domain of unknown function (DUF4291)